MTLDLDFLESKVCGATFPKPKGSGAISGHAAGEPFDKYVEECIREQFPTRTFRQYQLLNAVLKKHPEAKGIGRSGLFGPPPLQKLLTRGAQSMRGWSPENEFEEKQNDTADIVVLPSDELRVDAPTVHLIDVKSRSVDRQGQPPNIISARKIATMCAEMIDESSFDSHEIYYVGVDWRLTERTLEAESCDVVELFKAPPSELYINWVAATQIQVHVSELDQSFTDSVECWCEEFLGHFVAKARKRIEYEHKKFIDRFEPYVGV